MTSCDFYIWVVVDDWHDLCFIDVLGLDIYDICCLDLFLFDQMLVSLTKFFGTFFDMVLHAFIGLCADVCAHRHFFFLSCSTLLDINVKGMYYRNAAFCYLTHNYNNRISKDLLVYWFKGICSNFER